LFIELVERNIKLSDMKKILLSLALIGIGALAAAQPAPYALGVRFYGGDNFNGAELSFQKGLNYRNRLELDASFGLKSDNTRIALVAIYHWDWHLVGGFSWYLGPGAMVSYDSFEGSSFVNVGLGGQIGIEYNFRGLPLLVSLDGRPMWDFLGDINGLGWGAALGLRYAW
jgi:hypothetical protein